MRARDGFGRCEDCVPAQKSKFQDFGFGVCFVLHIVAIAVVAFVYGLPSLRDGNPFIASGGSSGDFPSADRSFTAAEALSTIVIAAAVAALLSAVWLYLLIHNAQSLISCTIWTCIAINIVAAIVAAIAYPWLCLPWLLFAVLGLWFWCTARRSIAFAAANLSIAAKAIARARGTVVCAYVTLLCQAAWNVLWGLALVGALIQVGGDYFRNEANGIESRPPAALAPTIILMVFSFYWGTQFLRNTLHVVTSGTVGMWWAAPSSGDPTCGSIKRALTTSFGSIALGSMLIAIVQTLRFLAETARDGARRHRNFVTACLAACALCLIRMLEAAMRYFTSYAFCQVALYGTGFVESGKNAFRLFERRGWSAVFNDYLIDRTLTLAGLLFGACSGIVGAAIGRLFISHGDSDDRFDVMVICGAVSFVVGFLVCSIVSGVIESAVKTVFVCFAERPEALLSTHPEEFAEIMSAWWRERRPLLEAAGYHEHFASHTVVYS
jgi:hypothetical protein